MELFRRLSLPAFVLWLLIGLTLFAAVLARWARDRRPPAEELRGEQENAAALAPPVAGRS